MKLWLFRKTGTWRCKTKMDMGRVMKPAAEKDFSEISSLFSENMYDLLLPRHLQLIPGLNEVYELELAFYDKSFTVIAQKWPFEAHKPA